MTLSLPKGRPSAPFQMALSLSKGRSAERQESILDLPHRRPASYQAATVPLTGIPGCGPGEQTRVIIAARQAGAKLSFLAGRGESRCTSSWRSLSP